MTQAWRLSAAVMAMAMAVAGQGLAQEVPQNPLKTPTSATSTSTPAIRSAAAISVVGIGDRVVDVRLLEIPTPRWSTCDAVTLGRPARDDLPVPNRERA